jgi:hypothetical protein
VNANGKDAQNPISADRSHVSSDHEPRAVDAIEAEYEEFAGLASALAEGVAPVDPPAKLKASIMDMIAQTPQTVPAAQAVPAIPSVPETVETDEEAHIAPVTQLRDRPRRRVLRMVIGLSAAAACVTAGVVLDRLVLSPDARTVEAAPTPQTPSESGAEQGLVSLASASDIQRVTAPVTGGGEAVIMWSGTQGTAAFVGYDLSQISADEVLALWFVRDGVMVPAGTTGVSAEGKAWAMLVGPMQAGDGFGVTVEPKGAVPSTETPPVLVVES